MFDGVPVVDAIVIAPVISKSPFKTNAPILLPVVKIKSLALVYVGVPTPLLVNVDAITLLNTTVSVVFKD